jgi:hypothetical protein
VLEEPAMLRATATMSVSSSKTVGHAVPRPRTSYLRPMSKSISASNWSGPEDAHRHAAGDGALELLAAAHAAAVVVDELLSGMPRSHS